MGRERTAEAAFREEILLELGGRKAHFVECGAGGGAASNCVTVGGGLRVVDLRWQAEPSCKLPRM